MATAAYQSEIATLDAYTKDFTEDQRQLWLESTLGCSSAKEAIEAYEAAVRRSQEATDSAADSTADYAEELEKLGISQEDFDKYVSTLMRLNDAFAKDKAGAEEFAIAQLKCDQAVEDLTSNFESYIETINDVDRTSASYSSAINSLADDLTKLTGFDFGFEDGMTDPAVFLQDAENIRLIEEAFNGSNEALEHLRSKIAGGIAATINIDAELGVDGFNEQFQEFISWVNGTDLGEIDVSAGLETGPFFTMLNELIDGSSETAKKVQAIFEKLGWDMTWDTKQLTSKVLSVDEGGGHDIGDGRKVATQKISEVTIDVPTNFHFVRRGDGNVSGKNLPTVSPSNSSGSSGSGGGGGGSSKDPVEDAAKDAEEAVEKTAEELQKEITDAAVEAFNNIQEAWQAQINNIQFHLDTTLNSKELADLTGSSISGMWSQVMGDYQALINSNNQMATDLQNQLNQSLANGSIQYGSTEYNNMAQQIQSAQLNAQQAEIAMQELIKQREENKTSILEKIVDRFKAITDKWADTVNRFFTWWNKNWAVNRQIQANSNTIAKDRLLYSRYLSDANRIGVPRSYQDQIKNNTLDWNKVRTQEDGFFIERLLEYSEAIQKAEEIQVEIQQLYDEERNLIKQKLENIKDYYSTIEGYLSSITSRFDAVISLKEASGNQASMLDLINKFGAEADEWATAQQALWEFQTGITAENTRSVEEITAELESHTTPYTATDFYQQVLAQDEALANRNQEYLEEMQNYAELLEQRQQATTKSEKAEIQKEINESKKRQKQLAPSKGTNKLSQLLGFDLDALAMLDDQISTLEALGEDGSDQYYSKALAKRTELLEKQSTYEELLAEAAEANANGEKKQADKLRKQAKKVKLSSKENRTLAAVTEQLEAIDDIRSQAVVDNAVASSGIYQGIIKRIGQLQAKSSLKVKEQEELAMLLDEIRDINAGVAIDDLTSFASIYQDWWTLKNKETKSQKEWLKFNTLDVKIQEIQAKFQDAMTALDEEMNRALVLRGDAVADLNANYEKTRDELTKSYQDQIESDYDYQSLADYQKKLARKQALEDQEVSKGLKAKQKAELTKLTAELAAFEKGATESNYKTYKSTWESVYKIVAEYAKKIGEDAGELMGRSSRMIPSSV